MLIESPKKALANQNLMTKFDTLDRRIKNMSFTTGGLCIGTGSKKKVKIASTVVYLCNGVFKSKTTAEVAFTATTHDIPPNASTVQEACYFVCLDVSGTITLVMGAIASGAGVALMPELPTTNLCIIGMARIAVAAGATLFDASSDDLDAAHITDTYYDFGFVNPRFDAAQ